MPDEDPRAVTARTLAHYEHRAAEFWEATRDHDVTQNHAAFLDAIEGEGPFTLLDFGCGPGRDLHFRALGHEAVGLDGSARFVEMARAHAGCEVLHQDFLALALDPGRFHGIFANASLFHVPSSPSTAFCASLARPCGQGACSSAPTRAAMHREGWSGDRYGCYWELETWREKVCAAGFEEVRHYYRPSGKPRAEQPWLATVWRASGPQR